MFRIGLKFPVTGLNLNRIKKHGSNRLYLTARCYETRTKFKSNDRLFKDVTLSSRLSGRKYSSETKSGKSSASFGTAIAFTTVAVGAFGVLYYAKNDNEFRTTLEGWIPGTNRAIQIIFQEESSYFEQILSFFEALKKSILDFFSDGGSNKPGQIKTTVDCTKLENYKPPRPTFTPSALELSPKLPEFKKPEPELRISKDKGKNIEVVSGKPAPTAGKEEKKPTTPVQELFELEKRGGQLTAEAISAFEQAACAVQDYNKHVVSVIESDDATVGHKIWDKLKDVQEKKTKVLNEAEKKADEVIGILKTLQVSVDDPKIDASIGQRTIALRNIKKLLSDLDEAKKKFEEEVSNANITEKYWKGVKTAREKFSDELKILFPNININEKKLSIGEEAFDLFVLHMYHKVAFLQKELEKMQTVAHQKLNTALKSKGDQEKIDEVVSLELDKEKRLLQENFEKKLLEERKVLDENLRNQLKLQEQVHADHLREVLATKDRETERKVNRALSERKEEESIRNKNQLAAVIGRLRGLDEALKNRIDAEKDANEAQLLWGACQALVRAVRAAPPGTSPENSVRPLGPEIKAIAKAAPKDDTFVSTTIKGIPEEASKRGVFPEDALRERFLKVEQISRRLALVPEEGASLPIYLLSYLQNFLLVKAVSPIPKHELEDQPIDPEKLDTYEILQRARYWMDRGDLKMTLRYMNLLKGAPRSVARDWMNEARILLETQQAIESLVAYAGANSLVFMGGGDPKGKK